MNKIKSLRKTVLAILCCIIIASCAALQTGVQQVELGMSKAEVAKKLGNDYQVVSLVQLPEGKLEVLKFSDWAAENGAVVIKGYYILHFLDNKLVELNHENVKNRPNSH